MNFFSDKNQSGFTIIETMIAVSLFLIVVMFGMGALLNANLLHEKSDDMRSLIDNLSFAMEDISRSLKTGNKYFCIQNLSNLTGDPNSCADGIGISFVYSDGSAEGSTWIYYISNGRLFKAVGAGAPVQLTADEIVINEATSGFSVLGAEPPNAGGNNDNQQPFVTLRLSGSITYKDVVTPFSLQTSASSRYVDVNTE